MFLLPSYCFNLKGKTAEQEARLRQMFDIHVQRVHIGDKSPLSNNDGTVNHFSIALGLNLGATISSLRTMGFPQKPHFGAHSAAD